MSPTRLRFFCPLLLLLATSAGAQNNPEARTASASLPPALDQAVYKGLVGNVLDVIPMDPSGRLDLQRTNAVVSNTLLGRSLNILILAGLSNPVLMVGGFVWGLWAASNIKPTSVKFAVDPGYAAGPAATKERPLGLRDLSIASVAIDEALARTGPEPVRLDSNTAADPATTANSQSRVIKIWLPQRAPALPR